MTGLEIKLGEIAAEFGSLSFAVVVESDGVMYVQAYASPQYGRREGVLLRLGDAELRALRKKLDEVDAAAEKLTLSGITGGMRR